MNTHQNKIALVTGATRGIGLETVRLLAQAGVHTLLAGRKRETAVELALKLQAEGLPVEALQLDVTDAASIAEAVEQVRQRHGRLDILVNNAGIMIENPAQAPSEQSLETWKRTFDTNVYALVAVTQAFLPLVKQAKSGRIVNVSSMLGSQTLHADPSSGIYDFKIPAYNASKAAVNSWTLSLAYELRNTPIKVNTVHPGYVKTDMNGGNGEIEISEGARSSVEMALIGESGASGSFTYLGEVLPW
ncbi:SDR family oxidoreductase [Stenotrophomonas maltophilia]|uniref:SDR family oxidoreductase n=1 Tax=Stenotrophomonas maltophilia TaxID=40324 RepID=UPI00165881A1|nr:SDR family oxidoreductase [Stenotrophomonas maltophilia]MBC9116201.1 SDR family oxidoreductase [Stenotrophomonas maltophilia]